VRPKSREMFKKIKDALTDNEYQTSFDLAKKTGLSRNTVSRLIRMMRMEGIGVMPTHKGYVLSEFASKKDDVHLVRRLYGRRTGDFITMKSCEKDILHRWKSIEERKLLQSMISPFSADLSSSKGMRALLTFEKKIED
jgi:biotin operon repressor